MKKLILIAVLFLLLSSKGRIAWYGEREFEQNVSSLKQEGYTIGYIDKIDEKTLAFYDVLVICFADVTPEQKDTIRAFVKEGGGLLIVYNVMTYPQVEDVVSAYDIENPLKLESDVAFPFLTKEVVENLKKRIAISQSGKGRIILVGYDPLTFQTVSFVLDINSIFKFGLGWLCQDWHVEKTQELLNQRRLVMLAPVVVAAAGFITGYYLLKRKKKKVDKSEQIRVLKAKFVYGELSRDQYQKELEKLERSEK